jgi:hypothetical protein
LFSAGLADKLQHDLAPVRAGAMLDQAGLAGLSVNYGNEDGDIAKT